MRAPEIGSEAPSIASGTPARYPSSRLPRVVGSPGYHPSSGLFKGDALEGGRVDMLGSCEYDGGMVMWLRWCVVRERAEAGWCPAFAVLPGTRPAISPLSLSKANNLYDDSFNIHANSLNPCTRHHDIRSFHRHPEFISQELELHDPKQTPVTGFRSVSNV